MLNYIVQACHVGLTFIIKKKKAWHIINKINNENILNFGKSNFNLSSIFNLHTSLVIVI